MWCGHQSLSPLICARYCPTGRAGDMGLVGDQVGDPVLDLVVALFECSRGMRGFGLGVSEIPECMCDVITVIFKRLI